MSASLRKLSIIAGIVILLFGPKVSLAQELVGIKIYYSNKIVKIKASNLTVEWAKAPDDDVQVVNLYYKREGENKFLVDELSAYDFYWHTPAKGFGQTNEVQDIPTDASYKRGKWMYPDEAFLKLYNKAHNDKEF